MSNNTNEYIIVLYKAKSVEQIIKGEALSAMSACSSKDIGKAQTVQKMIQEMKIMVDSIAEVKLQ